MNPTYIKISIGKQLLSLTKNARTIKTYSISSAINGTGCQENSACTPLGLHKIKLKIGKDCPVNSVFIGRRSTGEVYSQRLARDNPNRDWILSRIIWLTGLEPGINKGKGFDSLRRFIYIHGTPDSEPMSEPRSKGCVRMRNNDIVNLFDAVENNMLVKIYYD